MLIRNENIKENPDFLTLPLQYSIAPDKPLLLGQDFFMNQEVEIWKDIVDYEGLYQVNENSEIKSLEKKHPHNHTEFCIHKSKILKPGCKQGGYKRVILCKDGKKSHFLCHRLAAIAFIPNPLNLPMVNHVDSDVTNNHISNFEWATCRENITHGYKRKKTTSQYTGVSWHSKNKKWIVVLMLNKKLRYMGSFESEYFASVVYNFAIRTKIDCF